MAVDSYHVKYVFDDGFTEAQVKDIVAYLVEMCGVESHTDGDPAQYAVEMLRDSGSLRLNHEGTVFDLWLSTNDEEIGGLPSLTMRINEHWILPVDSESDSEAVARMNKFYTLLGGLYEHISDGSLEPAYVYGLNFAEFDIVTDPDHVNHVTRERIENGEVPGIFWFQIFPPAMVSELGKEQVLLCPAYRLDQLSDGAILLAADQGVLVSNIDDKGIAAAEHLGIPIETSQ